MLRVCGITYDHTSNYGSCLQAYALQTIVNKQVIGGEACEYALIPLVESDDYPRPNTIYGKARRLYYQVFHRPGFVRFEKKFMHYTKVSKVAELGKLNDVYDAFVCGSDVIWSTLYNKNQSVFYLDFATKYAFSYAASIGKSEVTDAEKAIFKTYIPRLNGISVREESTASIIRECINKTVVTVVDPVLLLDVSEWDQIAGEIRKDEKYIFAYTTNVTDTYLRFLKKIKEQTGLKVICAAFAPGNALKSGIIFAQSPQRWLQQLRDAEYVVTNSFHGTAFSVLYHKKFFTVVQGEKDSGINVRMNDFLNNLGLENRIYDEVPETIDISTQDFSAADCKIREMREQSMEYLRSNLEAAYQQKLDLENKEKN